MEESKNESEKKELKAKKVSLVGKIIAGTILFVGLCLNRMDSNKMVQK